jgi:hypothetical protein
VARLEELLNSLPPDPTPAPAEPVAAGPEDAGTATVDGASADTMRVGGELQHAPDFSGVDDAKVEEAAPGEMAAAEVASAEDGEFEIGGLDDGEFDEPLDDEDGEYDDGELDDGEEDTPSGRRHREFVLRKSTKKRGRPSTLRSMAGIVVGGIGGLVLAAYLLIWLRGPQLDLFRMADWLPEVMLPTSMQTADAIDAADMDDAEAVAAEEASEEVDRGLRAEDEHSTDAELAASDAAAVGPSSGESATDTGGAVADRDVEPATHTARTPVANGADDALPGTDATASESPAAEPPTAESTTRPSERSTESQVAETPAADEPIVQEPAGEEPALTFWPTTPIVADLAKPHFYSLDDLTEAAIRAPAEARAFVAGDFASDDSQKAMGRAYIGLCKLAERYTMTDPNDYGTQLFNQQAVGRAPLQAVANSVARRQHLARIAAKWWAYDKRSNEGILVVGTVKDVHPQGNWHECTVEVTGTSPLLKVPVLMDGISYVSGTEVAVAGVIVKEPAQRIAKYEGDAPQVVVAGYMFVPAKVTEVAGASPPGS